MDNYKTGIAPCASKWLMNAVSSAIKGIARVGVFGFYFL